MNRALRLDRIDLNTRDLGAATAFYCEALGFEAGPVSDADPAFAALLGARSVRMVLLNRAGQKLCLTACDPPGAPYPQGSRSCDLWFQHCALVTADIAASYARLIGSDFTPISRSGPETLPGGIMAFKFRDPEGHPLELIQFPNRDATAPRGIDHSAISVGDTERSIAFYAANLGLAIQARQVNSGPEQDALDDLQDTSVAVIALTPQQASPHLELLGYHTPRGRTGDLRRLTDIAASRVVFATDALNGDAAAFADGTRAKILHDPDGHALLLEHKP